MKRPTTINLDPETRERLERVRAMRVLGRRVPSLSDVASAALDRGLDVMLAESEPTNPPRSAA